MAFAERGPGAALYTIVGAESFFFGVVTWVMTGSKPSFFNGGGD